MEKIRRPRYSDIGALSCNVYEAIILITKGASINPYMPRIRFDLNAIDIMSPTTLKLRVAYDYVFTFLQPWFVVFLVHLLDNGAEELVGDGAK